MRPYQGAVFVEVFQSYIESGLSKAEFDHLCCYCLALNQKWWHGMELFKLLHDFKKLLDRYKDPSMTVTIPIPFAFPHIKMFSRVRR